MRILLFISTFCFTSQSFAQIYRDSSSINKDIVIEQLEQINSEFRDVNVSVTPNGRYLYFMSGRGAAPWSIKDDISFRGKSEYDGDIWYSEKKNNSWQSPHYLPRSINTPNGEDEPNISPDGQTVYFQSWHDGWLRDGGPYYRAERYGNRWQNPIGLHGGIYQFFRDSMNYYGRYATDGMSISPDGSVFIVAAGKDYDGNLDLYISRKNERGYWSYPKRLTVSTDKDERSVFIAGDGKTIYFGSDGHGGLGGLDIFKTTLLNLNRCGKVINIGPPFNTDKDDYGFIIGALGNDAYFVREDDIYYADLNGRAQAIKPMPTIVINGIVKDCNSNTVQSSIELYDLQTQKIIARARSNSVTGEYSLAFLKKNGSYVQRFKLFSDQSVIKQPFEVIENTANLLTFEIKPECKPMSFAQPTPTEKVEVADSFVLIEETIYFDFDQFSLTNAAQAKLDSLIDIVDTVAITIKLTGHTDSKGTNQYNMQLSERRANSVAAYFRDKLDQIQTIIEFKGEEVPLIDNTTAANRAKNRRVEISMQEE